MGYGRKPDYSLQLFLSRRWVTWFRRSVLCVLAAASGVEASGQSEILADTFCIVTFLPLPCPALLFSRQLDAGSVDPAACRRCARGYGVRVVVLAGPHALQLPGGPH